MILLDRDGVLNRLVIDPEHGTIDSPLHPSQVVIAEGAPLALRLLTEAGFAIRIVTNQPAAAKGKTTRENLEETHRVVLAAACAEGGKIQSSHICFHRAEDDCTCRKPRTGLLEEALTLHGADGRAAWMVGDGITDVQAGAAVGARTAFLAPRKCDACGVLRDHSLTPTWWGPDLLSFAQFILAEDGDR
jgi:D-glycero-D-manno-heptose 1,7-bisphosphate phosphatase